ncbi:expressed unknown protein [Seminavis robusta]|uniref:Uncharacterized protein n=1 Tax=Seminavis robusta TaxID=568900 RepID=A0A9N8H9J3_9STRA|nr:expressed unknown protein [Seminavis robusta]|eukprot:Sro194_g082800.1 n/a (203) ;mRNA; f:37796-38404
MFGKTNNRSNDHPAVAYSNVRLVEDRSVDLYIHNSRGKGIWKTQAWLEEGRPRELASLNIATWSLLTTSIKDYQLGLRQAKARIYVRMVLPMYFLWLMCLMGATSYTTIQEADMINLITSFGLIAMIFVSLMVSSHFQQVHVDEVFNPAVQSVLQELAPKLTEAGWEVTLMTEAGSWCRRPTVSFLRFTPLPDEEKAAAENQ